MIVIIGESASGKTTLVSEFIKKHPEYHKIVTYTTRPMREGEENGVDYNFIPEETFDEFVKSDFFIEHAEYRGWGYGTGKTECEADNAIAILTPAGLRALQRLKMPIISVYLWVDRRSRLIKLLSRGDDIEEAYRRNLSDAGQFDAVDNEVDFVIDNNGFHMGIDDTVRCLEAVIQKKTPTPPKRRFFGKTTKVGYEFGSKNE